TLSLPRKQRDEKVPLYNCPELVHQRRVAVRGDAQLLTRASHGDVEQSASLLITARLEVVAGEQQDVCGVESFGAMDRREPHGPGRLAGQQEGRRHAGI